MCVCEFTEQACYLGTISTLGKPPDESFNDSVSCSRSGTVFGSFDTLLVVGSGSSFLLMTVNSTICLSEIVFRIFSVSANRAELQIDVNAER